MIKINFKELYGEKYAICLDKTKTNLILVHSPITVNDYYTPNYYRLAYTCPQNRTEEHLSKFFASTSFNNYYPELTSKSLIIGECSYFSKQDVGEVIQKIFKYLIKYHLKENLKVITSFNKYIIPIDEILKKSE